MPQFLVSFYQLNPIQIIGNIHHISCWSGELMFHIEKLSNTIDDGSLLHIRGALIQYYIRNKIWVEISKEEFFTLTKNEMSYSK
jgi:hypothetical protein